jgi:threonine synthase
MKYVSTRGKAPILAFDDVLLAGLASDGGLYIPQLWPEISPAEQRRLARLDYSDLAYEIIHPFVGDVIPAESLRQIVRDSYAGFAHPAVAPLKQLAAGQWLMELFHGPTLAFKDYALQLVGRLFDHVLAERGQRVTIVGATSGDTGSAAIEACRGRERIEIFILHPRGRVSEVQRRQMTTRREANVHNIAVEGTFDDCQDQVKAMFNDQSFREELQLSAVNSINWARIMAQIAYYFSAALALGAPDRKIGFSVPSGNFGNVYAGYAAKRMGLNIGQLIVATNANDILARFIESGSMSMREVQPTHSPSMDIQVSSNFERLLFDILQGDGPQVAETLQRFRENGSFDVDEKGLAKLRGLFDAFRLDDQGTLAEMRARLTATGELLDPHSAIATAAAVARRRADIDAVVSMATAHPAKFPAATEAACGRPAEVPARLAEVFEREERCVSLPNDLARLQEHIREKISMSRRKAS